MLRYASVVLCATALSITYAADVAPETGLAAKYPGDVGIEKDPAVVFTENFEEDSIDALGARWAAAGGEIRKPGDPKNMRLQDDIPSVSSGKKSLSIYQAHLYAHLRPVDQLYARYYQKYHPQFGYPHHLPFIIADYEPTPWPKGWAGKKPDGDKFFCTNAEAWGAFGANPVPGKWTMYSYWQDMKPDGRGDYWGNGLHTDLPIERGRWTCVEIMLKANTAPDKADGEQAMWIDGKRVAYADGVRWRSTDALKINTYWLLHDNNTADLNQDTDPNRVYDMGFDDLVLATEYIGPIQPAALPAR